MADEKILELDERVREAEQDLTELRTQLTSMWEDVKATRKTVESMRETAVHPDTVNRLERDLQTLQKEFRSHLSDYARISFQHESCMVARATESALLNTIKSNVETLRNTTEANAATLATLVVKETRNVSWIHQRLTKLVDLALPVAVVLFATMLVNKPDDNANAIAENAQATRHLIAEVQKLRFENHTTNR